MGMGTSDAREKQHGNFICNVPVACEKCLWQRRLVQAIDLFELPMDWNEQNAMHERWAVCHSEQ